LLWPFEKRFYFGKLSARLAKSVRIIDISLGVAAAAAAAAVTTAGT